MVHNPYTQPTHQALKEAAPKRRASTSALLEEPKAVPKTEQKATEPKAVPRTPEKKAAEPEAVPQTPEKKAAEPKAVPKTPEMVEKEAKQAKGALACLVEECLELPWGLLRCCIGRFAGFDFALNC